ncbi:MAG: DUF1002 domain-containing protein [Clostridiales bacterium]|nr:DUF1002 domain-containing protein [Clostridiales bacterium]
MKKILTVMLAALMALSVCSAAFALNENEARIVLGADLTDEQKQQAIEYFGVTDGTVPVLTVTNRDERQYFEGKLPDEKLGHVALSSIYMVGRPEGSGLHIETFNINYVTAEMYENALISAGITDAQIKIWAPRPLSGTAALTGIYKAYEDMTGRILDAAAKDLGIEELIATGELAEYLGSEDALNIIRDLKKILDETKNMSDEDVMTRIHEIAAEYNATLTDEQSKQVFTLARMFEGLSPEEIQQRLVNMANAAKKAQSFGETVQSIITSIGEFFKTIGDFFADIWNRWFGGNEN